MDKTSTIKSAGNLDDVFNEMMVSELNLSVNQVKEEIRSVFAKHRKSLTSRELWLLDQLHSIKDGCFAAVLKQQISLAEMKARLQECATFSQLAKDCEFVKGMELVSEVAKPLYKRAKECQEQVKESVLPSIRFSQDKVHLRNAILSYGKLETSFQGADDADSFASEHSWDFVDEKAEIERTDKNGKNGCCIGNIACCQQMDIEDMDFSKMLLEDDLPIVSDSSNVLKSVCKANELCTSISDCVCDTPCLAILSSGKLNDVVDPVSDLRQKLNTIYRASESDPQPNKEDIGQGAIDTPQSPQEELSDNDPLLHISTTMHDLLSTPLEIEKKSSLLSSQSVQESCVFISDLNQKLQDILDGNDGAEDSEKIFRRKEPDECGKVGYESPPWDSSVARSSEEENAIVVGLHGRLGRIYREGVKDVVEHSEMTQQLPTYDQESDPVLMLSKRMHQILTC